MKAVNYLAVFLLSLSTFISCSPHNVSKECGEFKLLEDGRVYIDSVFIVEPGTYKPRLRVIKSYTRSGFIITCSDTLENRRSWRSFGTLEGKEGLYLLQEGY